MAAGSCFHGSSQYFRPHTASLYANRFACESEAVLTVTLIMQKPKAAGEKKPKTTKPKVSQKWPPQTKGSDIQQAPEHVLCRASWTLLDISGLMLPETQPVCQQLGHLLCKHCMDAPLKQCIGMTVMRSLTRFMPCR